MKTLVRGNKHEYLERYHYVDSESELGEFVGGRLECHDCGSHFIFQQRDLKKLKKTEHEKAHAYKDEYGPYGPPSHNIEWSLDCPVCGCTLMSIAYCRITPRKSIFSYFRL